MKVIDAHTHLVPGSPVFHAWAQRTGADHTLEGLVAEMDEHEVDRAIVIGHYELDEGVHDGPFESMPNNDLLHLLDVAPPRFRVLLGVNITDDGPLDLELLDEHLARPEVAGVKLFTGYETFYADDARCTPVYEVVERHRKVAMFHTGDTLLPSGHVRYAHPIPADEVAVAHPKMNIVLAHAGQHWMPDAGEVVGKNPNVWADISGWFIGRDLPPHASFIKEQFRQLVYWGVGCDKLMFGSDWPLMRIGPYIEFVEKGCADFLRKEERRGILAENAARLYFGE